MISIVDVQGRLANGKTWTSLVNEEERESAQIFSTEGVKCNMSGL